MNGFDEFGRGLVVFAFDIEHLAADHAIDGADGVGDEADDLDCRSRRRVETGKDFKGAGLQRVAGEDGDGFAERHVAGGFAATQIVVVECGQVVVDERVGVQHFDSCTQALNAAWNRTSDGDGSLHGEHGTQALAPGKD